jgi:hypothetical protein
MQRIVKRFLLHKQRETDEVGDVDFEELKQDLQMVRYEMMNDLKRNRDETLRFVSQIQTGLLIMSDEFFKDSSSDNAIRYREFKASEIDANNDHHSIVEEIRLEVNSPVQTKLRSYSSPSMQRVANLSVPKENSNNVTAASSINSINGTQMTASTNALSSIDEPPKTSACSSLDSFGSSTESQSSSNEQTTEMVHVTSSPGSDEFGPCKSGSHMPYHLISEELEMNVISNSNISSVVIDLFSDAKLDKLKQGESRNELEIIQEEDSISASVATNTNEKKNLTNNINEMSMKSTNKDEKTIVIEERDQSVQASFASLDELDDNDKNFLF